jgi:thiamine kinase-like enzyme
VSRPELAGIFAQTPVLKGLDPDDFTITPLDGYTNLIFRLHNHQHDWVVRIPKPSTDRFIDRNAEAHNQILAQQLGLAPAVSWRDSTGITLTPTLVATRKLNPADFADSEMSATVLQPLKQLHRSGFQFQGSVNPGESLSTYFSMLSPKQQAPLLARMRQAERVLALLDADDLDPVPSHNDLVLENLLLDNSRLWMIDWEYSAMASPYWDLATLCNAAQLDLAQSRQLLHDYCADATQMKESMLFDYRGLLKLLNDCWMAALTD